MGYFQDKIISFMPYAYAVPKPSLSRFLRLFASIAGAIRIGIFYPLAKKISRLAPSYFRKSFLTAVKKSGISDFRFHDLRHTFASHLVLRYSHLSPDNKKRAVDILGRRMDTIWTPKTISNPSQKIAFTQLLETANVTE